LQALIKSKPNKYFRELLKHFFTNPEFLKFIERLLFDQNLKVQFLEVSSE